MKPDDDTHPDGNSRADGGAHPDSTTRVGSNTPTDDGTRPGSSSAPGRDATDAVATSTAPLVETDAPWQRLHSRMIWVDALQTLVSVAPGILAITVFGVEPDLGSVWPFVAVAVFGVIGAVSDAVRWVFTRYRVSENYVERRTGVLVRQYRSVRRDRIRSVDVEARLRHRLSGLRIVRIGAGQQSAAGEAAFDLDAVLAAEAEQLQRILLRDRRRRPAAPSTDDTARGSSANTSSAVTAGTSTVTTTGSTDSAATAGPAAAAEPVGDTRSPDPEHPEHPEDGEHPEHAEDAEDAEDAASLRTSAEPDDEPVETRPAHVMARLQPRWVIYNLFNIWALVLAAGVLWGGFWLASTFNLDIATFGANLVNWDQLAPTSRMGVALGLVAVVGVVGMAITFFTSHWKFELSRVFGAETTMLRTRQGLFHTKEVNRDEARIRGMSISEPVLWRWLGVTDTTLITTGLDLWSSSDPTTILPRGPKPVAQEVSGQVLQSHTNPVLAPLTRHPSSALRRRIWWALVTTALITGALSWMVLTDVIGGAVLWTAAALLPLALAGAVIAYRALGHTIAGDYLVVRSGLLSRSTTALQRTAVSTIAVSESLLQRRLGLRSVSAMTAAGYGAYDAPDVPALHAFEFANDASAGLLEPFLEPIDQGAGKKAG